MAQNCCYTCIHMRADGSTVEFAERNEALVYILRRTTDLMTGTLQTACHAYMKYFHIAGPCCPEAPRGVPCWPDGQCETTVRGPCC